MEKTIVRKTLNSTVPEFDAKMPAILKRLYQLRGIKHQRELECELAHLLPYHTLLGIEDAVRCLADCLIQQQNMLVIGDFDADGATSTAVAVRALRKLGAKHVSFLVPNRFTYGYGLTTALVEDASQLKPHVIVTVDNGISNVEGVALANQYGIKVVITDHHLAGPVLPAATAIVNPNQPNDPFPSKHIAGVGVIFYVMLALRRHLKSIDWFKDQKIVEPNMAQFLDLVALGTVADVVALDQNNRVLVHQGLKRIRAGLCSPGITALLEIANRPSQKLVAGDLGFTVGPRLNAAGRLDDMSLGIDCLLTDDLTTAREMAQHLDTLNEERKSIEQDMQVGALQILDQFPASILHDKKGICLYDANWHQGVIGILASRIKDKFHRPVVVFARGDEGEIKGSSRSIPGFHIRDALADLNAIAPHIIVKFGGHAMAAGLTIRAQYYAEFETLFNEIAASKLQTEALKNYVLSDGELTQFEMNIEVAEMLRNAGPWGQSFPEPMFDGVFNVVDQRLLCNKHLKMLLEINDQMIDAIAFNIDNNVWPNHRCEKVHIAYRLDVNEFKGRRNLQLIVAHLTPG